MTILIARLLLVCYLALIGYCVYRAVNGRPAWYWTAALLVYLMSTLFAMSIGGFTVAPMFALIGAALVHLLRKTPPPRDVAIGALAGLCIWAVWLLTGNITPVFWPGILLVELLLGN